MVLQGEAAHLSRLLTPMRNATWMSRYENQIGKKSRIMFATMIEYLFCGVSCMTANSLSLLAKHTALCGSRTFAEGVGHLCTSKAHLGSHAGPIKIQTASHQVSAVKVQHASACSRQDLHGVRGAAHRSVHAGLRRVAEP